MKHTLAVLTALLTLSNAAAADTITGSATYLQRRMLPPGAVVEVVLEDASRADIPAKTLAAYRIPEPGAPPYPFAFAYDPARIDPRHSYRLRASVRVGDRLLMTTDTAYPVLTQGAGNAADMILKSVPAAASAKPDAAFVNTYWKILTIGGTQLGAVDNRREPHLILRGDGSYDATVGCNRLGGKYELDTGKIAFLGGIGTLMACPPPLDERERALGSLLEMARGYTIAGDEMQLLDATGGTLATFMAVYF